MSTATQDKTETLTLQIPAGVLADIEAAASRMGLQPSSYLIALHDWHRGAVTPGFLAAIREVFTQHQETLRKLAE